ncbi:hypothetical protein NST33_20830 [Paenibacillus sp. FSL L8-0435]|uniref:hypothetical protein n=1 Tax=Paenibacillus sp. FSL L8-0435 TaxID=2954618 RepID=UPI0030D87657
MNNKSKVQNPLTIIAIFAGIAEIAGTGVLLGLPLEIQRTFIWFVMLFPVGLVATFFFVLVNKHNVLYAPSDFVDESNFVNLLLQNKNVGEVVDLLEQTKEDNTNDQTKEKIDEALDKLELFKLYNDMIKKNYYIKNSSYTVKNFDLSNENNLKKRVIQLLEIFPDGLTLSALEGIMPSVSISVLKKSLKQWVEEGLLLNSADGRYKIN